MQAGRRQLPALRGRAIAGLLAGCWRTAPPPPHLGESELAALAPLLLATGCAGLAWWRIRSSPLAGSPPAQALRQAFLAQSVQAAFREQDVRACFELLRSAGVDALLGKGWAAARLYAQPGLRPYGDVDLYVPAAQHARALAALRVPGGGAADVHRGLAELDDRTFADVQGRSVAHEIEGVAIHVFGPEDHLRLLCLHGARHGLLRPLWVCDVAAALEALPPAFDWARFAGGDHRRAQWSLAMVALARDLLGADVDRLPAAAAAPLPRWMERAVLREWSRPRRAHGARTPMAACLRRPRSLPAALAERWPNAVEATAALRAPLGTLPRLPLQLAECARRLLRFARGARPAPDGAPALTASEARD